MQFFHIAKYHKWLWQLCCKDSANERKNIKFTWMFFSECSLSYVKIVQMSEKTSSSLECFFRMQPILCKDSANEWKNIKFTWMFFSECSLSYVKIVQMSEKISSLLECFFRMQPILYIKTRYFPEKRTPKKAKNSKLEHLFWVSSGCGSRWL